MPVNVRDVLSNLLIVGHTTLGIGRITNALSPSAWAVDVEILMYACSCFCLARSERLTRVILFVLLTSLPLLWLTAKYLITQAQMVLANQLIYSFLPTALIPYTIGTYLWFVRGRISPSWTSPGICLTSFIMLFVCALGISRVSVTIAYAASLPFLAFVIIGLSRYNKSGLIEKMDTLLGRMSYPLYLTQWLCAYVVVLFFSQSTALFIVSNNHIRFTSSGFLAVLAVVLLGSLFLAIFIEGPFEDLRHRLIARFVHDRSKKESI